MKLSLFDICFGLLLAAAGILLPFLNPSEALIQLVTLAAHQLRLSEGQALEWISPAGGEGPIHADEPESEIWQKIWLQLTSEFAPEGLL